MINPLTPQLLAPIGRHEQNPAKTRSSRHVPETRPRGPAQGAAGLASSIKADGGLAFLTSRLEEKMGAMFGGATEREAGPAAGGADAIRDAGAATSPAATADRIVSFALGLHDVFSRQNAGLDEEELMARFETEIRRGINEGFGHARGVLGDLDLLDDDVEGTVDQTWDLVQQQLDEFFAPVPA